MEYSLTYQLLDRDDCEKEKKEARALVDELNLTIFPKLGDTFLIPLRDIVNLSAYDYLVEIVLPSDEKVILSKMGYHYDGFFRELVRNRNEIILRDLLMQESLRKSGLTAETVYYDEEGRENRLGNCAVRLYETALVILPENGELIRVTYSEMMDISAENYELVVTTDFAEKYCFSKMGRQYDLFTRTLSDIMNELSLKMQTTLKEVLPGLDPSAIRAVSRLLKEGRAASQEELAGLCPELWKKLEERVDAVGIKEEYDYLQSLARKEHTCIGLKRGLMGDLTGEYVWFLIPIYSCDPKQPGNAVAMEAGSLEGGGRATYFFRITGRDSYGSYESLEDLHELARKFIRQVNRCMLQINFRREPIYLSDEKLAEESYEKYRYAIYKLPSLQLLRRHFIGRVLHHSDEQWKSDVADLLSFNVSVSDDSLKWIKGG